MNQRSQGKPPRRQWVFAVLAVVLIAAAGEILASWFFARYDHRLSFPDPTRFVATREEAARIDRLFDPDLGWRPRYATPFGERPRARHYGRPLVVAFGDSFTHGDEVGDDETWAEMLTERLGGDVFNFGVGGFGLDQTLLRFEQEIGRRPAEVTIFAFIGRDLDRCFGTYFKFQQPAGFPLTKPRFELRGDALALIPNPVTRADELAARARDPAFVATLGAQDRWYNPYDLPPLTRPYLARLVDPKVWRAALASRNVPDLWNEPAATRLAARILQRFHDGSLAAGMQPVILHLPLQIEVEAFVRHGTIPSAVEQMDTLCHARQWTCWAPLRTIEGPEEATWAWFTQGQEGGHYSVRGNQWVADFLAPKILALLDAAPPSTLTGRPSARTADPSESDAREKE